MPRHRNTDRIARAIGAIVLGAAPCGAITSACSSSSEIGVFAIDGSVDAQVADVDGLAADSSDDAVSDGGSCAITATPFDAGILFDAEGGGVDLSCTYTLPCGLPPTLVAVGCETFIGYADGSPDAFVPVSCTIPEGQGCTDGSLTPGPRGELSMICLDCFGGGRRPRGLRKPRIRAKNALGEYFARMAHEEHASVFAFARMHEELVRFRAPRALRSAALRAKGDEIFHAREMTSLAEKNGGRSTPARLKRFRTRSLEAIAIENAVEGCIHETFGAVLILWQSRHASDARVRLAFRKIAVDEARHAALAWSLATWFEKRLDPAGNRRVLRARNRAVRKLTSARAPEVPALDRVVGLPSSTERIRLVTCMLSVLDLA
ncbi:MAG: ferritin-like domain-containing protein [Polyangiaceae bacterium]